MLRFDRRLLQNVDWPLLGAALFIIGLGLPASGASTRVAGLGVDVAPGLLGRRRSRRLLVVVSVDYRHLVRFAPLST